MIPTDTMPYCMLFDVISVAGHYSFMTRILEVTASTFMSASWT